MAKFLWPLQMDNDALFLKPLALQPGGKMDRFIRFSVVPWSLYSRVLRGWP
ncbi:MAG: hypothetical protein ACI81A_002408 [Paraglaciecola sp.]|jgi:hypothetical protein